MNAMPKSWTRRRRYLSDSKSSVPVDNRTHRSTAHGALTAVPDRRGHLADGILIEGKILARVLGIRILKVDTTVVVAPADISAASSLPGHPSTLYLPRTAGIPANRSIPTGHRLAEAVQRLNEGAELLATARRNRY